MAYLGQRMGIGGRMLAAAAAVLIHTAAGAALVTGMDGQVLKPIDRRTLTGINLPPPPPRPRTVPNPSSGGVPDKIYEPEGAQTAEAVPDAMSWLVPPQEDGEADTPEPWNGIPEPTGFGSCACCDCGGAGSPVPWERYEPSDPYPIGIQGPPTTVSPPMPGHPATPANDPATWFAPDELPLHERYDRTDWMGYSLIVDRDGGVAGCEIVRFSSSPRLETAVCRLITLRALFEPATDWDGTPVQGTFNGTARWEGLD